MVAIIQAMNYSRASNKSIQNIPVTQQAHTANNLAFILSNSGDITNDTLLDKIKSFIANHLTFVLAGISVLFGGIVAIASMKSRSVTEKTTQTNHEITKPTKSREQTIRSSMKAGNGGNSCHTMATLNAIRALYALEGKEMPDWFNDLDNGKEKAFNIIRQTAPDIRRVLQDDGYIENSTDETTQIVEIILNHFHIPFNLCSVLTQFIETYENGDTRSFRLLNAIHLLDTLIHLEQGKIGILAMSDRGGHAVTCYGFKRGNNFNNLATAFNNSNGVTELEDNPEISRIISEGNIGKINIYDQHRNTHESIDLSELLSGEWFSIHILKPE